MDSGRSINIFIHTDIHTQTQILINTNTNTYICKHNQRKGSQN